MSWMGSRTPANSRQRERNDLNMFVVPPRISSPLLTQHFHIDHGEIARLLQVRSTVKSSRRCSSLCVVATVIVSAHLALKSILKFLMTQWNTRSCKFSRSLLNLLLLYADPWFARLQAAKLGNPFHVAHCIFDGFRSKISASDTVIRLLHANSPHKRSRYTWRIG